MKSKNKKRTEKSVKSRTIVKKKKSSTKSLKISTDVQTKEIVKVIWKDHFSANKSWTFVDDMDHTPKLCVTVGIKVNENNETLTLAQNMASSEQAADTTTILKNCITERKVLGEVFFGKKA